jgi:Major tropism determinant N-terminal domain
VAIVQVSQITNRKGLAENLPQLAGAELGWATDTRRLYIGNGTLVDGAPVIGNTEILTEYSDVFTGRTEFAFGDLVVKAGTMSTVVNNTTATVFTIDATAIPAFEVRYMIRRGVYIRTGTLIVVGSTDGTGASLTTTDANPVQNGSTGVTFNVSETASTISVGYTSTNTGVTGSLYYSITYFQV